MTTAKDKLADAGIDTTTPPNGNKRALRLPDFEGREVTQQRFIFTGSHKIGEDNHDPHGLEQIIYAVVQLRVTHVDPKLQKDGTITRVETSSITRFGFLPVAEGNTLIEKYAAASDAQLPLGDTMNDDD